MMATRPVAGGPASSMTWTAGAASCAVLGCSGTVCARTRAQKPPSSGQPADAWYVKRMGSTVS